MKYERGCQKCYGRGSDQGSCWNKQNPAMWVCVHCLRAVPVPDPWLPLKAFCAVVVGLAVGVLCAVLS